MQEEEFALFRLCCQCGKTWCWPSMLSDGIYKKDFNCQDAYELGLTLQRRALLDCILECSGQGKLMIHKSIKEKGRPRRSLNYDSTLKFK